MGKASGVSRRRRKAGSFHYKCSNKLKRQRLRELRKCGSINCNIVREAWDNKKSLKNNMKNMGLAEDPNKLLSEPKLHEKFANPRLNAGSSSSIVLRLHELLKQKKLRSLRKKFKKSNEFNIEIVDRLNNENRKPTVAEKLSEVASKSYKNFRLSPDQINFCAYMLEKYGEDYESMARDKRNYYQESPGQIRAKIKKFLSIPSHREVYEKAKKICENRLNSSKPEFVDDSN